MFVINKPSGLGNVGVRGFGGWGVWTLGVSQSAPRVGLALPGYRFALGSQV